MTPVEFRFLTLDGNPLAGAPIEIHLDQTGYINSETGIVLPSEVAFTLDEAGRVLVPLAPSATPYHVLVRDLNGLDVAGHYTFLVPEIEPPVTQVRLQDILVTGSLPVPPYDEAALVAINEARANAVAAALAAEAALAQMVPLAFQVDGVPIVGPVTTVNFVGLTVTQVGSTLVVTAPVGSGTPDPEIPEGSVSLSGVGPLLFNNNLLVVA